MHTATTPPREGSTPAMTADSATYGLARPTLADLYTCVTPVPAGDAQLWFWVCLAAGTDPHTDDPAALGPLIAAALTVTTGPVRVAVASLNIRLRAHTVLSARARAGAG